MLSRGHIWEERMSANLFLTHSLVSRDNMRWSVWIKDRKEMEFSRQKKKINPPTPKKSCVIKCSLWRIFQLNDKIKKNQ